MAVVMPMVVGDAGFLERRLKPIGHVGHSISSSVHAQECLQPLAVRQLLISLNPLSGQWDIPNLGFVSVLLLMYRQLLCRWVVIPNPSPELLGHSHATCN